MNDLSKANDALSALNDIAESEPRFFKANFVHLLELANKICTDKDLNEIMTKDIILETMVATLERIPAIINENKNGKQIIDKAIELILNHLVTNISP